MDKERLKNGLSQYRGILLLGGPTVIVLITAIVYLATGRYVSTDDAYIQAARTEISSNVSGRIVGIYVQDNQPVRTGDLLFKIDDRDYVTAVNNAKARLANVKLQVTALKATYKQQQAVRGSAQAALQYMRKEYKRQQTLAEQGIISQQQLELAREEFVSAEQSLRSSDHDLHSILAQLNQNAEINVIEHPLVQQAQAELDQAELYLSYTAILAPSDGIVTKVNLLQVGDYLRAADAAFALVSTTDVWVEANYKETELTYIRPGQTATFTVDAYPDRKFTGKVVSISPGTGGSFSLLPPENATGNWVKVVQRLPVRISIDRFDPKDRLRMGMSVVVNVDTKHSRFGRDT